jgi:hypothetical protein
MHSNSRDGHVWIALVLAAVAAMLSDPRRGAAYQEISSMLITIEPIADELAGAIADAPQLTVAP